MYSTSDRSLFLCGPPCCLSSSASEGVDVDASSFVCPRPSEMCFLTLQQSGLAMVCRTRACSATILTCESCPRPPASDNSVGVGQAPKRHIGGSGLPAVCTETRITRDFGILPGLRNFVVPLFRGMFGLLCLAMWQLLLRTIPGRRSPLGRLVGLPSLGVPILPLRALGHAASARCCVLDWKPHEDAVPRTCQTKQETPTARRRRTSWSQLAFFLVCWFRLPVCVWAAPKGLSEAARDISAFADLCPEAIPATPSPQCQPPDIASDGAAFADLANTPHASDGQSHERTSEPHQYIGYPRPTPGRGMPVAEEQAELPCLAYVVCPFFQPEMLNFRLAIPCEALDVARQVRRHVSRLALSFADVITPAFPQPTLDFTTSVVHPDWLTFAGLSAVVLDLRLCPLNCAGPIIASYVTRPTNVAELSREAGMFSTRICDIYVGDSETPLDPHDTVLLEHGCLVRFVTHQQPPGQVRLLQDRVCCRSRWPLDLRPPAILPAATIMLLHSTGRYHLNRAPPSGVALEESAVRLVGVDRIDVVFVHAEEGLSSVSHRGANVHSVVALAPSNDIVAGHTLVFLDFRQIAAAAQFVMLPSEYLDYDVLAGLLPRQPPKGWKLSVLGGRRRRHYFKVRHGETSRGGALV